MTILIDTGFYVALSNSRDNYHERAHELLESLQMSKWGSRLTTDYILDETITTVWSRTKRLDFVENSHKLFFGPLSLAHLIFQQEGLVSQAWEIFQKYTSTARPLSFTDCSLIALAFDRKVENILSFDSGFDGILNRIF